MTRATRQFSARSRRRLLAASLLASALLALGWVPLAQISTASAGEWIQRSCSHNGEYIAPEGWEGTTNNGYRDAPREFCELGGGFAVFAAPASGDEPYAGQAWTYKAPHNSTIAGGALDASLTARNGLAAVEARVDSKVVPLQACEYPTCEHSEGRVSIPAGASQVSVIAFCLPEPSVCHGPGSRWGFQVFSSEGEVTSPEILLSTSATPKAAGFSGSLFQGAASGSGTLDFTATDPGPGVYQVRAKLDGEQVLAETPYTNKGKCAPVDTSSGIRVFNYAQPCPTEVDVRAEVQTASVADGTHSLEVEVEDAAGNVSTAYAGLVTTLNHALTTSTQLSTMPPDRGSCNGSPCDDAAKLSLAANDPKSLTRAFGHSPVTLEGRLMTPTGAPIKNAQVKLLQQVAGSAAKTTAVAASTNPTGAWKLRVPAGPSRLLRVVYYSHVLDTIPAATLDVHETVRGAISLHAPSKAHVGRAITFSGQLAGGYVPADGESIQMEIRYGGRWRTIEVLPTTRTGRWTYKYIFTIGAGVSYLFRAATVPNGGYPFASVHTKPVRVIVVH
jgi:hypothetical protein